MRDEGESAWKGEHKLFGALGDFLRRVREGEIPAGTILVIEQLDRLSREKMRLASSQFLDLINAGVKIVTTVDGREHSAKSVDENPFTLYQSMNDMDLANRESQKKSERLSEAWHGKRLEVGTRIMTAIAPKWLKAKKDRTAFEAIPERAAVIRRIFRLYLDGHGADRIAKTLNTEGVKPWRKGNGWHASYIKRVLKNPAVHGELQPHQEAEGSNKHHRVRVPVGDPIPDYYPAVIDKGQFALAQERIAENAKRPGRLARLGNLFSYIARCGHCGGPMQWRNRGTSGGQILICNNAYRGVTDCNRTSWPYQDFEAAFLSLCNKLNVADLLPGDDERTDKIRALKAELEAIKGKQAVNAETIKRWDAMVATADETTLPHFQENYRLAFTEKADLEKQRER